MNMCHAVLRCVVLCGAVLCCVVLCRWNSSDGFCGELQLLTPHIDRAIHNSTPSTAPPSTNIRAHATVLGLVRQVAAIARHL